MRLPKHVERQCLELAGEKPAGRKPAARRVAKLAAGWAVELT